MIDAIRKTLCELMGISEAEFREKNPGDYAASNKELALRRYFGKSWEGLEARRISNERWEFDIVDDNDTCVLGIQIVTPMVPNFRQAAAKLKDRGDLYARLNDGCYRRISDSDRLGYSTLTLEVKPGEESQAAKIIYSLLARKTKPHQTPVQPNKKPSKFEKSALLSAEKSGPFSKG